jgi:hypothetical protein
MGDPNRSGEFIDNINAQIAKEKAMTRLDKILANLECPENKVTIRPAIQALCAEILELKDTLNNCYKDQCKNSNCSNIKRTTGEK